MALTTTCSSVLTEDILFDCSNIPVKGFATDGVIVNRKDVDFDTLAELTAGSHVYSNFPLLGAAEGYKITQPNVAPYTGTQQSMNQGAYYNTVNNEVHFIIPEQTATVLTPDEIANGEFVVILRKKITSGYKYLIFGLDCGLKATEITRDFYDDDTIGSYAVTLTEEGAPTFTRELLATTQAATETLLATLVTHTP